MYFQRRIFSDLREHLSKRQITVITGMRRTGKSTLVKQLLKEEKRTQSRYLDLQRLDYREMMMDKNYDRIYENLTLGMDRSEDMLIALDEIQLVPDLPGVVKYIYDHYKVKFVLTGSSSYYIKNLYSESLAGRKKIFELYPLDFGEFLGFNGISYTGVTELSSLYYLSSVYNEYKVLYESYLSFGGFPEVVLAKNEAEKKDLIFDIFSSYINIDISGFSDLGRANELMKLVRLLASRIGNKLDISKISTYTGLSRANVENYLRLLEDTYLISAIPVISFNPDKEIVKAKKLYFNDNGIVSVMAELSSESKFENAIFNQLKKFGAISYYQLKTGNEIDFIVNKKEAFEVKETATPNDLKKIQRMASSIGIEKSSIVSKNITKGFEDMIWGGQIM